MDTSIDFGIFAENGEYDDRVAEENYRRIVERFEQTPDYGSIGDSADAPYLLMHYAGDDLGKPPHSISRRTLEDVLYDIFPRKVVIEPERATVVIAELRAFFSWLDREFALPHAKECLTALDDAAEKELAVALGDSENFSMGKAFFMLGKQSGFEMTDPEDLEAFRQQYNSSPDETRAVGRPGLPLDDVAESP